MSESQPRRRYRTPIAYRIRQAIRGAGRALFRPRVVHRDRLIVPEDASSCSTPIFLIGLHRSGTTLLRQIIDTHSSIACPPETYFLLALSTVLAETEDNRFAQGLTAMGYDRKTIAQGLRRSTDFFLETYRQSKGKPRWAEKTPEYTRILPFIEQLYGPACQYVMVYRHPMDTINSLLGSGFNLDHELWNCLAYHEDHFTNIVLYHADMLQKQLAFGDAHRDRCHGILYENLVLDPEPVLRGVLEFLDEPWEDELLRYYEKPHDRGFGDPVAVETKGFKPSIGNWMNWDRDHIDLAAEHLRPYMERLGYSTDEPTPHPVASPLSTG